jgi:hypothetical protein
MTRQRAERERARPPSSPVKTAVLAAIRSGVITLDMTCAFTSIL